jgi:N-carbamoylputrescine amidase
MACSDNKSENIAKAEKLVREATSQGAQIILLQELFEDRYFCQEEKPEHIEKAVELENSEAVRHFTKVAKELNVVIPISFFERKNQARFNSMVPRNSKMPGPDGCRGALFSHCYWHGTTGPHI